MDYVLDRNKPHQRFFEEISRIPRQSFREQQISDYLVAFAKDRGLWCYQDSIGNVVIKKDGTIGLEESEPVMLQAHLDMVCEKISGSVFDFTTEPIQLAVENGWVKARGTTLGADDGAGVALMLAILDHPGIKHPPLECVFTVQEEDGMGGALQLDYSKLSSKRLIALDGLEEGTTIVSTTGIHCGYIVKECPVIPIASVDALRKDGAVFSLKISGLRGGHAALNIGKGQGNAIQIAAEILSEIFHKFPLQLISFDGGSILNGIPQECEVRYCLSGEAGQSCEETAESSQNCKLAAELRRIVQNTVREILERLNGRDPGLTAVCEPSHADSRRDSSSDPTAYAMNENTSKEVLDLICMLPVGVEAWDKDHTDFPTASRNLGTVSTGHKRLLIGYSCRGITAPQISDMVEETNRIAGSCNAVYQEKFRYSGYSTPADSPLISLWAEVYNEETGKELIRRRIHSGTDAGTIAENMSGMDIIVLMPNTQNVHTPDERMELASFDRTYHYLEKILERL